MSIIFPVLQNSEDTTEIRKALLSIIDEIRGEGGIVKSNTKAWREKRIILSNNTTDPANDIDFAVGQVFADDNETKLVGTAMTKRLDATFTVGNGGGGLDEGSKANSTWYAVFIIGKIDGTTDYLFSTSATSPTLPSGYIYKRRIGWIYTQSGGDILPFFQVENIFTCKNPPQYSKTNSWSGWDTARQSVTVVCAPNSLGTFTINAYSDNLGRVWIISSLDQEDIGASSTNSNVRTQNTIVGTGSQLSVLVNASSQIGIRVSNVSGITEIWLTTEYWTDLEI